MARNIHIHVGGKTKDAALEVEEAYQAIARARKKAQELVDRLSASMERTKAGKGVMKPETCREVELIIRSALNKVV